MPIDWNTPHDEDACYPLHPTSTASARRSDMLSALRDPTVSRPPPGLNSTCWNKDSLFYSDVFADNASTDFSALMKDFEAFRHERACPVENPAPVDVQKLLATPERKAPASPPPLKTAVERSEWEDVSRDVKNTLVRLTDYTLTNIEAVNQRDQEQKYHAYGIAHRLCTSVCLYVPPAETEKIRKNQYRMFSQPEKRGQRSHDWRRDGADWRRERSAEVPTDFRGELDLYTHAGAAILADGNRQPKELRLLMVRAHVRKSAHTGERVFHGSDFYGSKYWGVRDTNAFVQYELTLKRN